MALYTALLNQENKKLLPQQMAKQSRHLFQKHHKKSEGVTSIWQGA
jgi:hypothetical protein